MRTKQRASVFVEQRAARDRTEAYHDARALVFEVARRVPAARFDAMKAGVVLEPGETVYRQVPLWIRVQEDGCWAGASFADYGRDVIAAARRGGARFSITVRMNRTVVKAISGIKESAWTPIHYPNAIWDEDEQRLVSDAEVAEVPFTAFTSRRQSDHISARLIVRRVRRLNTKSVPDGQGELFPDYRHHAVFTDSPLTMLQAEKSHRAHAIVEQVIADLKAGALAHLPSSSFSANGAWLALAAISFNLTRAAGAIASVFHAKATTATIRRQLIAVPGRLAKSARRLVIHLPKDWPWQDSWEGLFNAACGPPTPATT